MSDNQIHVNYGTIKMELKQLTMQNWNMSLSIALSCTIVDVKLKKPKSAVCFTNKKGEICLKFTVYWALGPHFQIICDFF